jgi:hypothetical protein
MAIASVGDATPCKFIRLKCGLAIFAKLIWNNQMKRPRLPRISDEMRRMCVMLSEEILRWPGVRVNPMFGMHAYYRGKIVFAMIPDKRAFDDADSIMYKMANAGDKKEGKKWKPFKLTTAEEGAALDILDKAYRKAKLPARKK